MKIDLGSEIRPVVDLAKLSAAWEQLDAKEQRTLGEIRLAKGNLLREARKAFPTTGNDGAWAKHLEKWKIPPQTARDYMKLAGYVESTSTNFVEAEPPALPTYAEAGIKKQLAPKLLEHGCADCGEMFTAPIWHCPGCAHHWPPDRETCRNCHNYRSDGSKIDVEEGDDNDEMEDVDPGETRPLFHAAAQRGLPPKMEERETQVARLRTFWDRVYIDSKKLGAHLTDATTSIEDFHSVKNTLIAIANLVLEELERAGVLAADGQQKQRLLVLDGGKGK